MSVLKMGITHASEMRRLVEQGVYEKAQTQADFITQAINEAVANGQMYIGAEGRLEEPVKARLIELGYICEAHSQYNRPSWVVSWATPPKPLRPTNPDVTRVPNVTRA